MNRTKNYIILDTETATLPFIREMELTSEQKKKIAIAKPLVYDIGWTIANRTYGIVEKRNFLVAETFAVPQVFNTAYYAEKRPLYYEMIAKGEATVLPWDAIMDILVEDLKNAAYICAYNAMFDFKKAIIFTEAYIRKVYSPYYHEWEENQKILCAKIAYSKEKPNKNPDFDPMNFVFRGEKYPMIDIWGVACNTLLNCNKYKNRCLLEKKISPSGLYFSTNAETAMQYLSDNFNFIEDHTALSDAEIETEILFRCLKRHKIMIGIDYFPYKHLGETIEYIETAKGVTKQMAQNLMEAIEAYLPEDIDEFSNYHKGVFNKLSGLKCFVEKNW